MADRKPIVLGAPGHPEVLQAADRAAFNNAGVVYGAGLVQQLVGTGSPEGVAVAPIGSIYMQVNGTLGKTIWFKESGVSSSGWISSDPWTYVKQVVVQNSTAVAAAATAMLFAPAASKNYEFEGRVVVQSSVAATGPRVGINWPTGTITRQAANIITPNSDVALAIRSYGTKTAGLLAASTGLTIANTDYLAELRGIISTGAAPVGSLAFTIASENAGTQVSVMPGSFIRFREIP